MENVVQKLQSDFPQFTFVLGERCVWSPVSKTVTYRTLENESDLWSTLHELGHGLLGHQAYTTDIELLTKEAAAWNEATKLASAYGSVIDQNFIEDCLDTYRDWLFKRSRCPTCMLQGIQRTSELYACLNCKDTWQVSAERFCRPYRQSDHKQ